MRGLTEAGYASRLEEDRQREIQRKKHMEGLHNYLLKCEIEYIAKIGDAPLLLAKRLGDKEDALSFLKDIGFRIKKREAIEIDGQEYDLVLTTNNISIDLNSGFCIKQKGNG